MMEQIKQPYQQAREQSGKQRECSRGAFVYETLDDYLKVSRGGVLVHESVEEYLKDGRGGVLVHESLDDYLGWSMSNQ